jgi:hypothetical protein
LKEGLLEIVVLGMISENIESVDDNKATHMIYKLHNIHPTDKIDLHRKTREMVFSDLLKNTTNKNKMETMVRKVVNQLKK